MYDPTNGYYGISNICDFIGFHSPFIYYFECKTIKGNTFPFSNLTQYEKLYNKVGIKGVRAGAIIWFYEKDAVLYAPISTITEMKKDGEKSINYKKLVDKLYKKDYNIIMIPSEKKRVFMDSDYSVLLNLPEGC